MQSQCPTEGTKWVALYKGLAIRHRCSSHHGLNHHQRPYSPISSSSLTMDQYFTFDESFLDTLVDSAYFESSSPQPPSTKDVFDIPVDQDRSGTGSFSTFCVIS